MKLDPTQSAPLRNPGGAGDGDVELLLLEARPIGEPGVQHGPFVMNSRNEIMQAFQVCLVG